VPIREVIPLFGILPNVGFPELMLILALALIIFGPGKLPEVGRAVGKSIREFKGAMNKAENDIMDTVNDKE